MFPRIPWLFIKFRSYSLNLSCFCTSPMDMAYTSLQRRISTQNSLKKILFYVITTLLGYDTPDLCNIVKLKEVAANMNCYVCEHFCRAVTILYILLHIPVVTYITCDSCIMAILCEPD